MPPAKAGGKAALVLQCEWEVCTYVASEMEEFCEHVAQHLQRHLPGEQREEMDPLGEDLAASGAAGREPPTLLLWHISVWERLPLPEESSAARCRAGIS